MKEWKGTKESKGKQRKDKVEGMETNEGKEMS